MKSLIKDILFNLGYELRKCNVLNSDKFLLKTLVQHHHIDLLIDVGANAGQFALELRKIGYQNPIVSFEPLPEAFAQLALNSKKDPQWEVHNTAIGDREGTITMHVSENSESSSILPIKEIHVRSAPQSRYITSVDVPINYLDTFYLQSEKMQKAKSIFLKVDVQGFEKPVFDFAEKILSKTQLIQVELSFGLLYEGALLYQDMIALLDSKGFELYNLIPNFVDLKTGRMWQADGFFVRKEN